MKDMKKQQIEMFETAIQAVEKRLATLKEHKEMLEGAKGEVEVLGITALCERALANIQEDK